MDKTNKHKEKNIREDTKKQGPPVHSLRNSIKTLKLEVKIYTQMTCKVKREKLIGWFSKRGRELRNDIMIQGTTKDPV